MRPSQYALPLTTVLFCGLLLVCFALYYPGLQGGGVLDDGANLERLGSLAESPHYLVDVVFGNQSGPLGRSLSMLTFAMSWLAAQGDIRVFKYHNLLLHLLTAAVMFLLSLRLFDATGAKGARVPLLITALWLFAPLHVSTVLYVVQRMAQLSALFVLAGLYLYAVGRQRMCERGGGWWCIGAAQLCGVAAALAKENGALYWPLQLLVEVCFFHGAAAVSREAKILRTASMTIVLVGIFGLIAGLLVYREPLLSPFARRDFTLVERVYTEARILWQYVFRLVWPWQAGYGVFHDDIAVSRGLLDPPSTLLSLGTWCAVTLMSVICIVRRLAVPLVFGALFFLLAHAVESSFLPLELYFEHRNYLAAFGVAVALIATAEGVGRRLPVLAPILALLLTLLLVCAAIATGIRASIWGDKHLLAIAHVAEHPGSTRANMEMATTLARMGDVDAGLAYAHKSYSLAGSSPTTVILRDLSLYCMADMPAPEEYFARLESSSDDLRNAFASEALNVLVNLAGNQRCPVAGIERIRGPMERQILGQGLQLPTRIYGLMAVLENHYARHDLARRYVMLWLGRNPEDPKALMMLLYFELQLGNHEAAGAVVKQLHEAARRGELNAEQAEDLKLLEQYTTLGVDVSPR